MGRLADAPHRVLILGGGRTGRAVAELVHRRGGSSLLADDRAVGTGEQADETAAALAEGLPQSCRFVGSSKSDGILSGVDLVVPSPGVPIDHPVLAEAVARGVDVQSEIEFASRAIEGRIAAVTGTNGKSTTVTLLASILRAGGQRVFVGGNLGRPLAEAVGEAWDWVVVEISSFQLEWVSTLRPRIAALLNVGADHIDRHGSVEVYHRTKLKMFVRMGPEDLAITSRVPSADGNDDLTASVRSVTSAPILTFGRGTADFRVDRSARRIEGPGNTDFRLPKSWPVAPYDFLNAAAAVAMAVGAGASREEIEEGLAEFRPLDHRLALVATIDGVEFWNDSKATNVDAALASLEAFASDVILLAGGVAKGAELARLAAGAERIKLLVAYGEAAPELEGELGRKVRTVCASGLGEAFAVARSQAACGDKVLLAPACASFDEFRDYVERGRHFVRLVEAASAEGAVVEREEADR